MEDAGKSNLIACVEVAENSKSNNDRAQQQTNGDIIDGVLCATLTAFLPITSIILSIHVETSKSRRITNEKGGGGRKVQDLMTFINILV